MVGHARPGTNDHEVAAVVALNAPVDLLAYPPEWHRGPGERAGIEPNRAVDYSPIQFVRPGIPPILVQHGTSDTVVPIDHVRRFREAMVAAGNDCVLIEYEGAGHAFHYPGPDGNFNAVMSSTTDFIMERLTR
jgi:dipeptidyl aminopeptidase/acylaminoacyl peptidase